MFVLAKDVNTKRKYEIKAKNIIDVPKCKQLKSNYDFLTQNVPLITKYLLCKIISLLTSLQAEIQGGGEGLIGLPPASFVWQKAQPLRIKV